MSLVKEQFLAAFLGAALALAGNALWGMGRRGVMARRLAAAFFQELSAVAFRGPASPLAIGGFSSQTFDSLFREALTTLPVQLADQLMAYHWRMKYLADLQVHTLPLPPQY